MMSSMKSPTKSPFKSPKKTKSPQAKFVKPADLFRMRGLDNKGSPSRIAQRCASHIEPQSPLKCLNNLTDASPVKNLPTILKNPFNQPVKRRLNLDRSSPKKSRMLELDEDANLEPPKMKTTPFRGEEKSCIKNDWALATSLKIKFHSTCKNWTDSSTSTHRRSNRGVVDSPGKLNDQTISLEAIKNITTVYQHPYMSWQPLYPRFDSDVENCAAENSSKLVNHSHVSEMMFKDWCEGLDDLCNLLIEGRCKYFYLCSHASTILFYQVPSSNPKKPLVKACITPFFHSFACKLEQSNIEYKCPEITQNNSLFATPSIEKDNSQASSFGSIQNRSLSDLDCSQSSRPFFKNVEVAPSVDSGNASEEEQDEALGDENDEDASQTLMDLGIDGVVKYKSRRKGFENDSNTASKPKTSSQPKTLASIEGTDNIRKLVKLLKLNRSYIIANVGRFAYIPATLLSPCEFRLSTPQCPRIRLSELNRKTVKEAADHQKPRTSSRGTPKKTPATLTSPKSIEIKGTILPHLFGEIHKLLVTSDNMNHSCMTIPLESSLPFKNISYL